MDVQRIAQAFANTLDPSTRAQAETELEQVRRCVNIDVHLLVLLLYRHSSHQALRHVSCRL